MKAFQQIFTRFGIGWATPVICLLLAFGGVGGRLECAATDGPDQPCCWEGLLMLG